MREEGVDQSSPRLCPSFEGLPRKEVIQPQVPLRLPCYDFTPVTEHSLGAYLPCGLATLCTDHCSMCVALGIKGIRT